MPGPTKPIPRSPHDTVALVLAGGLGTRLRSVYRAGPKVLAPVANRPFLDYLLRWLRLAGFSDVVLCVGYKREQIQRRYKSGDSWGLRLSYSAENEPLGTGGAIKLAQRHIHSKHLVVLNGDSFVDVDLSALLQFHRRHRALATMALAQAPPGDRYGNVRVNAARKILEFVEKGSRSSIKEMQPKWINGGVYVFRRELLRLIPAGRPVSLERDIFPKIKGRPFYGYPVAGYFIDIGVPKDYGKAQREFPKRFSL